MLLFCAAGTAEARNMVLPKHKSLTLQQTIQWQQRIIRHDQWVIRTRKTHYLAVVFFARQQLKWVGKELRENQARLEAKNRAAAGALTSDWACIHSHEGAWDANTGNGYYGGLQMDMAFQSAYGGEFLKRWGTADKWPVWAQVIAAVRARGERGYHPWPNTAAACGLL